MRWSTLPVQAEAHADEDQLVTELIERVNDAGEEPAARTAFRKGFDRLRSQSAMYPVSGPCASTVFESAAKTARNLAAGCLPLGVAVAMHLYPLCALQCVPLPLFSAARFQRALLLRMIRNRSLILANAGSERAQGTECSVLATPAVEGIRIDGTYEYMSLGSVADIVFFEAKVRNDDSSVLCAADLRADSVRIGDWKFGGRMRLSDTSSVTFKNHLVPPGRYLLLPNHANVRCISDYQRCWFHLFLVDIHLARLERLQLAWKLPHSAEHIVTLNEVARLREYSLRLLDEFPARPAIEALTKTTSAMKLRVSLMAQSAIALLCNLEQSPSADTKRLRADASELRYIKAQPTSDEKILRSLGL